MLCPQCGFTGDRADVFDAPPYPCVKCGTVYKRSGSATSRPPSAKAASGGPAPRTSAAQLALDQNSAAKAAGAKRAARGFVQPSIVVPMHQPTHRPRMNRTPFYLAIVAVAAFGAYKFRHRFARAPAMSRATEVVGDPCFNRSMCIVVYMAPWCPSCAQSIGTVQEMDRRWNGNSSPSTRGIRVLMGQDEPEKCRAKANEVGAFASVDVGNKFGKLHGITAYPTWIVFDANGKERKRVSGSFPVAEQADQIATQVFGL